MAKNGRSTAWSVALCILAASAISAEDASPFQPGETLTYDVTWSIFRAGQVVTTLKKVGEGPTARYEAKATGRSQGFASLIYRVDDQFNSGFNATTFCSSGISKKTYEGRRHKETQIVFDTVRRLAILDEGDLSNPGSPRKHAENEIPACVEDVISAFYSLRTQPLRVGHEIRMPINDGSKTYEITVEVQSRDRIPMLLGGSRMAFRVEPRIFGGLYKKKGRMFIWISDDQQHLPLRIRVQSTVGSITGNLKSVTTASDKASPAEL